MNKQIAKTKESEDNRYRYRYTYLGSASRVVNGAGEEDSSLAIDENGLAIVGDSGVGEARS